jgi:uncharacterized protein YqjF (DUF2071 family)
MTADEILAAQDHRTFPLPNSRWVMRQEWHDLLFAHWQVPVDLLRQKVPAQLQLDLWHGDAYVGVVPFVIRNLRPRGVPAIPVISHFPENNVRTYVTYKGIPGVYFFSLDAANLSAVLGARFMYALPYHHSKFRVSRGADEVAYESRRVQRPKPADFRGKYRPVSGVREYERPERSLERFVTERYCLYAVTQRHVYRTVVHHLPWPLQVAEASIEQNTMAEPVGIPLPSQPPLLHFSKFMDVLTWLPEQVD